MKELHHSDLQCAHDTGHTDIAYFQDGSQLLTCGSDGDVRLWTQNMADVTHHICIGLEAYSVIQAGTHVYVCTDIKDVQLLSAKNFERNGILARYADRINHIVTSRSHDKIALAGEDNIVRVIALNAQVAAKETVEFIGAQGPCISVAVCEKYVAAGSGDGKLRIWNLHTKEIVQERVAFPVVTTFKEASSLCRMDFNRTGTLIAYPENDKVLVLDAEHQWTKKCSFSGPACIYSIVQFSCSDKYLLAVSTNGYFVLWNVHNGTTLAMGTHKKNVAICGLSWNPVEKNIVAFADVEGQVGTIDLTACQLDKVDIEEVPEEIVEERNIEDDDTVYSEKYESNAESDDDDENVVSLEKLKKQYMPDENDSLGEDVPDESSDHYARPQAPEIRMQSSFMPSSTPGNFTRYLCWNHVGVIRRFVSEQSERKTIDVEFHNRSTHGSIIIANVHDFHLGHVSRKAVVLANHNFMNVIPLEYGRKEWQTEVISDDKSDPTLDEIELIGVSEELVCYITRRRIIKVYSIFGTPRGMACIPGPPVSVSSYKNTILIAYHAGPPRDGDQCVAFQMIIFDSPFKLESIILQNGALQPGTKITWLGFSDLGTPCVVNSNGMLSMMPLWKNSQAWIPFCDTTLHRKHVSDGFFVCIVHETRQSVAGFHCHGAQFPQVNPHIYCTELPLQVPFTVTKSDEKQLELELLKYVFIRTPDARKKMIENGIKLFALHTKTGFDYKAFELIKLVGDSQLTEMAIRYASEKRKMTLAEQLMNLLTEVVAEENTDKNNINSAQQVSEHNNVTNESSAFKPLPPVVLRKKRPSNARMSEILSSSNPKSEPVLSESTPTTLATSSGSDVTITSNGGTITTIANTPSPKSFPFSRRVNPLVNDKNSCVSPLSLTDPLAGIHYKSNESTSAKRKQDESLVSDSLKPKKKQTKFTNFMAATTGIK